MKSRNRNVTPQMENAVARAVNFEVSIADLARRSERRARMVAMSAVVMSLILAGGYFYMLPLKQKVPYLVMADAYGWHRKTTARQLQQRPGAAERSGNSGLRKQSQWTQADRSCGTEHQWHWYIRGAGQA